MFNEFSTIDVHLGGGSYVMHAWVVTRDLGPYGQPLEGSHAYLPVR